MNPLKGYRVRLNDRAQRDLKKLDASVRKNIFENLEDLVSDAHCLNIRKLEGCGPLWRLVSGNYRVIYEPLRDVIIIHVVFVGHRKDVYKLLKRFLGG